MPKFYMLIGVPASGKSFWRKQNAGNAVVISTDDFIEDCADSVNSTYNDVFKDNIKLATKIATERAREALAKGQNVVWDQTNLTKKSRATKLAMLPKGYEKIAVFFPTPHPYIHKKRLANRPGKNIPDHRLKSMIETLEPPSIDEGFDSIVSI